MKKINFNQSFLLAMMLVIGFLASMGPVMAAKSVKDELDAAKKARKTVFLVVTAKGIQTAKLMTLAEQTQKKVAESMVLSLNRDDIVNKEVVKTLGLGSVEVPMIMVIGMNGIAAGGLEEKEATVEKLIALVPSPKKAEALAYLNDKKAVFIIVSKKGFTDKAKALENCKAAVAQLKGQGACMEVDMDDPKEKSLLTKLGADFKTKGSLIIVFNAEGKNAGSFSGLTDATKLVTAVKAAPKSCCPPGSGKKCN